jgi:hypothetical protein
MTIRILYYEDTRVRIRLSTLFLLPGLSSRREERSSRWQNAIDREMGVGSSSGDGSEPNRVACLMPMSTGTKHGRYLNRCRTGGQGTALPAH